MPRSGRVKIYADFDGRGLNVGIDRASGKLKTLEKSSGRVSRASSRLGGALKGAAKYAVGAAAAYVGIAQAKEAISTTEDLAKTTLTLHKNLGLSVKSASEWASVAKARGVEGKQLAQSFGILAKNVTAAEQGTASAVKPFRDLGITQKELRRLKPEQLMIAIADGMKQLGPGTQRTADSMKLFGRGWQTIVPLLRDGSGELRDQIGLANKYGATFGGKSLKSVQDLIGAQRELKIAQLGLQIQFTEHIAPALIKVSLGFAHFVNQLRQAKNLGQVGQIIGDKLGQGLDKAAQILQRVGPKLAAGLVKGFLGAPPLAKLAAAGWLFAKFGGRGVLSSIGAQAGGYVGKGVGEGVKKGTTGVPTTMGERLRGMKGQMFAIGKGIVGFQLLQGVFAGISGGAARAGFQGHLQNAFSAATLGVVPSVEQEGAKAAQGYLKTVTRILRGGRISQGVPDKIWDTSGWRGQIKTLRVSLFGLRHDENLTTDQVAELGAAHQRAIRGLQRFGASIAAMRSGTISQMKDIRRTVGQNATFIAETMGHNSEQARKRLAYNFDVGAAAVARSMARSGHVTKAGMRRIQNYLDRAKLLRGQDPLKFGRAFARSFADARKVTRRGINHVVDQMKLMPAPAKRQTFRAMQAMLRELVKGHKLTRAQAQKIVSGVVTRFPTLSRAANREGKKTTKSLVDLIPKAFRPLAKGAVTGMGLVARVVGAMQSGVGKDTKKTKAHLSDLGGALHHLAQVHVNLHSLLSGSISGVVGNAIGALNRLAAHIRSLPRHQTGHITAGPELAMIGEAGKEYVIPVENHRDRGRMLVRQAAAELGVRTAATGLIAGASATQIAQDFKDIPIGFNKPRDFGGHMRATTPDAAAVPEAEEAKSLGRYSVAQAFTTAATTGTKATQVTTIAGNKYTVPAYLADDVREAAKVIAMYQRYFKFWLWWSRQVTYAGKGARRRATPFGRWMLKKQGRRKMYAARWANLQSSAENWSQWQQTLTELISGATEEAGTDTDVSQQTIDAQTEKIRSLQSALATAQAQAPVVRDFLGSFAEGGVVPGPRGRAGVAIVHGGERISPPGGDGITVELRFAGGMQTLEGIIEAEIVDHEVVRDRRAGVARQTPSRPGRRAATGASRRRRNALGRR